MPQAPAGLFGRVKTFFSKMKAPGREIYRSDQFQNTAGTRRNPLKAAANAKKHGVIFEQAAGVFKDPMALTLFDEEQSDDDEDWWITLGLADGRYYLVVVHTYRDEQNDTVTIRLISARHATKHEIAKYQG